MKSIKFSIWGNSLQPWQEIFKKGNSFYGNTTNRSEPRHTVHKKNLAFIKYRKSLCLVHLHVCLFNYDSIWPGFIMRYRQFFYCTSMCHSFSLIPVVFFDNNVIVQLLISHLGHGQYVEANLKTSVVSTFSHSVSLVESEILERSLFICEGFRTHPSELRASLQDNRD